jgi:hypothetical protein
LITSTVIADAQHDLSTGSGPPEFRTAPVRLMVFSASNLSKYCFSEASISAAWLSIISKRNLRDAEEAASSLAVRHSGDNSESVEGGSASADAIAAKVASATKAKWTVACMGNPRPGERNFNILLNPYTFVNPRKRSLDV